MRIGIDIGGTFTDLVALANDGNITAYKILSTPEDFGKAVLDGVSKILERTASSALDVTELVHGTTVAANAILSGTGAKTGLITTRGFRDVLEIGRLRTSKLYDLSWEKLPPLVPRMLRREVGERIGVDGKIQMDLDEGELAEVISFFQNEEVTSVAVCLLNSYVNSAHEIRIGKLLRKAKEWTVTLSSEVLPEIREFERTSTTVVNAYILPVVQRYLQKLKQNLDGMGTHVSLRIMQSGGGVMDAEMAARFPVQIVESGPAAGVVAAAALGCKIGYKDLISFDMGGTTAKAALIEGGLVPKATDYEVGGGISLSGRLMGGGGYPIRVPCVDLAEVGAGGGSVLRVDAGGGLQVGPESAGADPGPVCYGRGGSNPTLTDANLILGYLNSGLAGGTIKLDSGAAQRCLQKTVADPLGFSLEDMAMGAHRIANARMVRAVRAVSAERGYDPRQFTLLASGGSGPLHAVGMAKELGIPKVLIPCTPGLFSTLGLLGAGMQYDRVRMVLTLVDDLVPETVENLFVEMASEAQAMIPDANLRRSADLRYVGQSYELAVSLPETSSDLGNYLKSEFEMVHKRVYGHKAENDPVEIVAFRLQASLPSPDLPLQMPAKTLEKQVFRKAYFGSDIGWTVVPVLYRNQLSLEEKEGPFIVEDYDATTLVPPGSKASLDEWGNILIIV